MSGFDDLVASAQPRLREVTAQVTEGRTWRFDLTGITDATDKLVDLTGYTITCQVMDEGTRQVIVTIPATGGIGTLSLLLPPAQSTGLAGDVGLNPKWRPCVWGLKAAASDGRVAQFWGPFDEFRIWQETVA